MKYQLVSAMASKDSADLRMNTVLAWEVFLNPSVDKWI